MTLNYKDERTWLERHAESEAVEMNVRQELQLRYLLDIAESLNSIALSMRVIEDDSGSIRKALNNLDDNYQWVLNHPK